MGRQLSKFQLIQPQNDLNLHEVHRLLIFGGLILLAGVYGACSRQPGTSQGPTLVAEPARTASATQGPETVVATLVTTETPDAVTTDTFTSERQAMVENALIAWGITDPAVMQVMGEVPRHAFVPEDVVHLAYRNYPLPIGYGQTISQPYIVALMTEALKVTETDRVLEIGTGSGYQAAILAELADQVYTIEIIAPLADRASKVHRQLGYENIHGRTADGYYGWPEEAPFDAIIVTAAPDHIPQPLVQQLKIGGRLVIPVGPIGGVQTLWLITRESEESVRTENLGEVRFVPFVRAEEPASAGSS